MNPPNLFDDAPERVPAALARNTDPATSHEAAASLDHATLGRLHNMITESLSRDGPATTSELAERLGLPRDSISPRMKTLEKKLSLVAWNGNYRPGPTGRKQRVWEVQE